GVSPHGADVFPSPQLVGGHAWGNAPPSLVRSIPWRRPAHNRTSQTHSPRPQAPRAHGHWCAISVLTCPPRLASPLRRSRRPWPPPSPRSTATGTSTSPDAAPDTHGFPTPSSYNRRQTAGRFCSTRSAYARCSVCISCDQRVHPTTHLSQAASPRGPMTPSSL